MQLRVRACVRARAADCSTRPKLAATSHKRLLKQLHQLCRCRSPVRLALSIKVAQRVHLCNAASSKGICSMSTQLAAASRKPRRMRPCERMGVRTARRSAATASRPAARASLPGKKHETQQCSQRSDALEPGCSHVWIVGVAGGVGHTKAAVDQRVGALLLAALLQELQVAVVFAAGVRLGRQTDGRGLRADGQAGRQTGGQADRQTGREALAAVCRCLHACAAAGAGSGCRGPRTSSCSAQPATVPVAVQLGGGVHSTDL